MNGQRARRARCNSSASCMFTSQKHYSYWETNFGVVDRQIISYRTDSLLNINSDAAQIFTPVPLF